MGLERLQDSIGYRFSNPSLLAEALTHRSFGLPHNERLEFLGDSVLNCVVSANLYAGFLEADEGELSRRKAHYVRQESLFHAARHIDLGGYLRLGAGELKSGGAARPSILADAFEALIGAVYLDGGFDCARQVIEKLLDDLLGNGTAAASSKDAKTQLQERLQARRIALPRYSIRSTKGAAHNQRFEVECAIEQLSVVTIGIGASRRAAEQAAARLAIERLDDGC